MTEAKLALPERLKPHLLMDVDTGEVVARLSDEDKATIRQIVHEEVAKVFPRLPKPNVGIPTCPDCGGWDLSEHDLTVPLDSGYRLWWCWCPEKVEAYDARCKQALDDLLQAIHEPGNEIEAVLIEMGEQEFEELIAKVRASR